MFIALTLAMLFGWWQSADKKDQPLVSAMDPAYLSCTVWTGKEWTKPAARSARTPQLASSKGFRAYAEVKVEVDADGSCDNTSILYVASADGGQFQPISMKTPSTSDGNGIRLIGWSPSGDKLLLEVTLWKYETDLGFDHVVVIYDAVAHSVKEDRKLDDALTHHFGPDCEFKISARGWKTDLQILVRISRTPESDEYEQHFCVKQPLTLTYNIQTNTLGAPNRPKNAE
jgi:hypothetical protein